MNSLTATLCKKPLIGVALWLTSLCATNQAFRDVSVNLGVSGVIVNQEISVPMDEAYSLLFWKNDKKWFLGWSSLVCGSRPNTNGVSDSESSVGNSLAISMRVFDKDGKLLSSQTFTPECPRPNHEESSLLFLGSVDLKSGKYRIEIENKFPITSSGVYDVTVLLRGKNAGYP